jgi:hypothetical protein
LLIGAIGASPVACNFAIVSAVYSTRGLVVAILAKEGFGILSIVTALAQKKLRIAS